MKKFLLCAICFAAAVAAGAQGYRELYEGEEAVQLRERADSISRAGDEAAVADLVSAGLVCAGADILDSSEMRSFGILGEKGDTLNFRNVVGVIPGFDKSLRSRYIVVGARLAADNAAALSLLVQLTQRLSTAKVLLQRSVIVAAFGGGVQANAGSWYFLNRAFSTPEDIDAYINLDLFGNPNSGFYAFTASNADLNRIVASLAASLQPALPELVASEPAPGDHRSFYAKEIPSVFFTTARASEKYFNTTDPVEYEELNRQGEYIYNFAVALADGTAPRFRSDVVSTEIPTIPFPQCERKPRFLGSSDPRSFLAKWVYTYLRYPEDALSEGIRGSVQVGFVIDESGKMRDVTVEKGVYPSLDAEAVRVIEASPDWKPGYFDGRPVRTKLSVNVEFRLKKKK